MPKEVRIPEPQPDPIHADLPLRVTGIGFPNQPLAERSELPDILFQAVEKNRPLATATRQGEDIIVFGYTIDGIRDLLAALKLTGKVEVVIPEYREGDDILGVVPIF